MRNYFLETSVKLTGKIEVYSDGKLVARDAQGRLVGTFDAKSNVTRDAQGRHVQIGDHLKMFLLGEGTESRSLKLAQRLIAREQRRKEIEGGRS